MHQDACILVAKKKLAARIKNTPLKNLSSAEASDAYDEATETG